MSKNELEKVMESKFFCPARFAEEIESLVLLNKDMNYIDAIVYFCEQNKIETGMNTNKSNNNSGNRNGDGN